MKRPSPLQPLRLDSDDRRALAQLGGYALLACGAMGGLLLLALTLALCVRLFLFVSGLGGI